MKKEKIFKIGCSGYYNRHWKGVFYPEGMPASQWFDYYCRHFDTLELNSTFYKFPTVKSLNTWFKKSPDDFIFSVKAPKLITHFKKFKGVARLMGDFYLACQQGLEHKLGCTLFQLPPSIRYEESILNEIIEALNPAFINVIEFRHKSWWSKKVYDALAQNYIVFCTVSHPSMPSTLVVNSPISYIRLHGVPRMFYSSYGDQELLDLYEAIQKKTKIKQAFIYFNNTADTAGVINAKQFQMDTNHQLHKGKEQA